MSKTLTIEIEQADIINRLSALSAYTGAKNTSDTGAYDRIATIDANDEFFDINWRFVVNSLQLICSPFIDTISYQKAGNAPNSTVKGIFIKMDMPSNWDETLSNAAQSAATNLCVAKLAELWFRMVYKEGVAEQQADMIAATTELKMVLYHKKRPTLPTDFLPTTTNQGSGSSSGSASGDSEDAADDNTGTGGGSDPNDTAEEGEAD